MAVRVDLIISLDGFATTTDQTPKAPFGEDWGRLVEAYVTTRTMQERVFKDTPNPLWPVLRMIQADSSQVRPTVDLTLVRLIVKARDWWQRLQQERGLMVSTIAEQEGVNHSYVTRVLRLAFLSPHIVQAIINSRQPVWTDSGALCAPDAIAGDWEQQKQRLLLGSARLNLTKRGRS